MATRRRSRQRALQILFLWDARRQPVGLIDLQDLPKLKLV
jgi:transcription termination factor NusB